MSARHPGSQGTNQKKDHGSLSVQEFENSKIFSLQTIIEPQTFTLLSKGPNSNVGTTWPINDPIRIFPAAPEITIDFSNTFAHYSKIELTSNDTTINFTNLIQNRSIKFILDITINTATFNLLTFNPTLENPPTLPTSNGSRYLLNITAYKTSTEEKYFVTGGTLITGGGGDFSDPLTQLLITLSTATLPSITTIDASAATEFQITLDENIEFDFTGGPAAGRDQVITLFILQNGTGNFTINWGSKVTNPPDISLLPNTSTTIVLVSRNQGTSWTVESASPGGSGGSTLPVSDITSIVKGDVDPTKEMRFEVDGFDTATIRVMTPPNADALLASLNLAQTFTGINTFENHTIMGSAGPFADSGRIRYANDTIGLSWRNAANDGNIELKATSTDILEITNSANDIPILSLRAQHATELDISSSWSQLSNVGGLGGSTIITYPTEFVFNHGATLVALFDENDEVNFFHNIDVNDNDIIKVDRLQISGGTSSPTSVNDVVWYLDSDGNLISNINAADSWLWTSGNVIKMILTDDTLQKQNVTAPNFELYNTRTAQVGTAGIISILANSSDISTGIPMGFLIADTEAIAGDGRGSLKLGVNLDGIQTLFLTLNEGNDEQLDILKETDFNAQDVLGINRLQLVGGTPSPTSVNDVVSYLDADGNLVSNINASDEWLWTSGNVIKMLLSDTTLEKRNVTAPTFQLYNTRAAQTGTAGSINILANSSDISTGIPMGFILADTEVITGDGTGSMKFGVNLDGVATLFLTMNDSNDGNVKLLTNLDLGANFMQLTEIALPSNPAANDGLIYVRDVAGTTTPFFLDSSGTETSMIASGGASVLTTKGDIFTFDTADARLPVGSNGQVLTADSLEALGVKWSAAGADLLPLTNVWSGVSNTYENQVNLNGATTVIGDETTDLIQGVGRLANAKSWIPAVDLGSDLGSIDNTFGSLYARNIFFDDVALKIQQSASNLQIETSLGNDIVFAEAGVTFVRMDGGLDQVTFLREAEFNSNIRIDGGNIIRAHDSAQCGFSVTDENTSPGTEGTLQMPRTDDTTPDAADLDNDFGSALGDHGLLTLGGLPTTPILVVKVGISPSTWRGIILSASGNTQSVEFT
jgi:hypothetical protein